MTKSGRGATELSREGFLLAVILLACFLGVDRFHVQAKARAHAAAQSAAQAADDRLARARSEASRGARLRAALGAGDASSARDAPIAIDYLNGVLAKRGLRKIDLRTDVGVQGVRSEPLQLTVQGSYEGLVLFLRDLESSRVPVWLRDVRISRVAEEGSTALEMRVRLEIEGTRS